MPANTPRILIAPAAFKGSLSAWDAAQAMADCLKAHYPGPLTLDICPVADGGDDTLNVLARADHGFRWEETSVTGPVPGQSTPARYLYHPAQKLAVLEAAQAHGYQKLPDGRLAPMQATSYGVGELIGQAIHHHEKALETLVVTLGGSASSDAGMGALQALGIAFLNAHGQPIQTPIGGGSLIEIQAIRWPAAWPYAGRILIATDVVNPLLGPEGTAAVFAPQKGASAAQCQQLEDAIGHVSKLITEATQADYTTLPGVGAAGGLAYGLRHLPRSGIVSGSQWVAGYLNLEARIAQADFIITGEGRFDATSFGGKATGNVLAWAANKPVMLLCGQIQPDLAFPDNILPRALAPTEAKAARSLQNPKAQLQAVIQGAIPAVQKALSAGQTGS